MRVSLQWLQELVTSFSAYAGGAAMMPVRLPVEFVWPTVEVAYTRVH